MTASQLRTWRIDEGLSQSEAARRIGVSPYAYRSLESGRSASPANVKKIAEYFGRTATEFLEAA